MFFYIARQVELAQLLELTGCLVIRDSEWWQAHREVNDKYILEQISRHRHASSVCKTSTRTCARASTAASLIARHATRSSGNSIKICCQTSNPFSVGERSTDARLVKGKSLPVMNAKSATDNGGGMPRSCQLKSCTAKSRMENLAEMCGNMSDAHVP